MTRRRAAWLTMLLLSLTQAPRCFAQVTPFPVLPGLETAVDFWQQIFTRFGSSEVVFFDPLDLGKIYRVVRAAESDEGRLLIDKERARIVADYDLSEDESRVRSQRGAREPFLSGLRISGRYISQMRKIFRAEGVPEDLAYLPLVESSFNVRARSSVGAVGMWQFMPDTGKKFLQISDAVDERRDPLASTRAAARLLKENYRILGQWPLAITAYNHGTEGLLRGVNAVGSRNLVDLIQRYQAPTFGFASKNFYAEFVAAITVATDSESHFPFLRLHRPVALLEVEVKKQVPLEKLLTPAAISRNDFFEWNPALNATTTILPVGYRVKLPADKVDGFVAAIRQMSNPPGAKKTTSQAKQREAKTASLSAPTRNGKTSINRTVRSPSAAVRSALKNHSTVKDRELAANQVLKSAIP